MALRSLKNIPMKNSANSRFVAAHALAESLFFKQFYFVLFYALIERNVFPTNTFSDGLQFQRLRDAIRIVNRKLILSQYNVFSIVICSDQNINIQLNKNSKDFKNCMENICEEK